MTKLDKQSVIGISALLVHAANIDEIYSNHEKDLKPLYQPYLTEKYSLIYAVQKGSKRSSYLIQY